jgi:hypothetical protein
MAIPTAQGGWTTSPQQAAGESDAAFQARLQVWIAGGSGVTLGGAGMPKPVYRAAGDLVSPSGAVLGAFPVASADALPAPTRMGPFGRSAAGLIELDDPSLGRGSFLPTPVDAWGRSSGPGRLRPSNGPVFRGPIGALPTSLREPTDPTPYDLERETARLATGYDPSWGTPPDRLGLAWDPVRFLYEPTNDRDGLPYAFAARDARYLQAVQRPDGTWSERWVLALAQIPDRDRPYRALDRAESSRLDAEVARMRGAGSSYDARWKRGEITRYENPAIEFTPRYGPAKQAPKLSDFAWIGWRQLPVGCPYPYPAMPVPIADYTSGRWLAEDYVPSIPLPSPYDQVAWRCGVPKQPGKPHKGGGGSPSEETTFPKQHSDLAAGGGGGASASSVLLDVGIPPPGGDIFLNRSPEDAPGPPPVPVDPPKKSCRILIVVFVGMPILEGEGATSSRQADAGLKNFVFSANKRAKFYVALGCTVTIRYFSGIDSFLCWTAQQTLFGKTGGPYLNVEMYSHGTSTGSEGLSKFGLPERTDLLQELGRLLRGMMSEGSSGQGYIIAGWCNACETGSSANQLMSALAGASGHEVIGSEDEIWYTDPGASANYGFLEPMPRIPKEKAYVRLSEDEYGREKRVYMTREEGLAMANEPNPPIPNSGWVVFSPVVERDGKSVLNRPDDLSSGRTIDRATRKSDRQHVPDGPPPVYGSLPFNPNEGFGGDTNDPKLPERERAEGNVRADRRRDPHGSTEFGSASLRALGGRPKSPDESARRPIQPTGTARRVLDSKFCPKK